MNKSIRSIILTVSVLLISVGFAFATAEGESDGSSAIIYNSPPQWANWGVMLENIETDLGIKVPFDNKNSGQSLAQLIAEKNAPVADLVYYGVSTGVTAKREGVVDAYKPKGFDQIPAHLKDKDGYWVTIHLGTIGLFVNKDALGDIPVPQSWADLTKPEYEGLVGFLDPSSAFVGYAAAVAINLSNGGDLDNFDPVFEYYSKVKNPIIPKQTAYARVLSGEIPILFDYDFNAYRAKYDDEANVEFIIPSEGTISVPYVMSVVKGTSNRENAEKILDYILSEKGQAVWAGAYLKPVLGELPADIKAKFNPDSDYERALPVDYAKLSEKHEEFQKRYLESR